MTKLGVALRGGQQIEDVLAMFSEMGARQRSLQAGERLRDEDRSTTSS
jgi:hypothetical protein